MIGFAMQAPMPVEIALEAFFGEHRRCGELDAGAEDGRVWATCCECRAMIVQSTNLRDLFREQGWPI
jgi:hypothetical protein